MDRFTQYAMVASDEAIADSGLNLEIMIQIELELFGVRVLEV